MRLRLRRGDVAQLLGLAAAAALATSLGTDPRLAAEAAVALSLFVLVGVALREPPVPRAPLPAPPPEPSLVTARRSIELALASRWGVEGRLRLLLREAADARLALRGHDLPTADLPPALRDLLGPRRGRRERGCTPEELDRLLAAVEELTP